MDLRERHYWVFDLDGTLTEAGLDFDEIRARLGLAEGEPILEAVHRATPERARWMLDEIAAWEDAHALQARPEPDAVALIETLARRGVRMGVLTRNRRGTALLTLRACGLARYFDDDDVVGRDCARPKPAPDGVLALLARWGADPDDAVMVGDWAFDIEAGRAAGTATVLVDRDGSASGVAADQVVASLDALEV